MKVLITGGCGFLGSNLARAAATKNHEVVLFDNLYRQGSSENLAFLKSRGFDAFVHGDIRNAGDVDRVVASHHPDAVFHCAGQVAMTTSIADPRFDFEINALGTLNILESVRRHVPLSPVLYSSTNKVYGDLEQFAYRETATRYECVDKPQGFDENIRLSFHSPYGCSKGAADQYMLDYARIFGLKTVVFRHSSMYGERQFATFDQGWIGWFCHVALSIQRGTLPRGFTISGTGKQVRDILHADDITSLYLAAVEHLDKTAGTAFNIGGGMDNSYSLLELFAFLEQTLHIQMNYTHLEPRESDQRVFVANNRSITEATGWSPSVSREDGVVRMLDWGRTILDRKS